MEGTFNYALSEEIMHAMEDEKHGYVFDTENMRLIEKNENEKINFDAAPFVSIPEWGAKRGFDAMLHFVSAIHQKRAREKLLSALYSRRNVFYLFKSEIKNYPLLEKKWHAYKKREMLNAVKSWWEEKNEERKLLALPIDFEECETEDLLGEDFSFKAVRDKSIVSAILESEEFRKAENCDALSRAVQNEWILCAKKSLEKDFISCAAYTSDDEIAAFIMAYKEKDEAALAFLKVKEAFRSLGLARSLLEKFFSILKQEFVKRLFVLHAVLPDAKAFFENCLFQKSGTTFFFIFNENKE